MTLFSIVPSSTERSVHVYTSFIIPTVISTYNLNLNLEDFTRSPRCQQVSNKTLNTDPNDSHCITNLANTVGRICNHISRTASQHHGYLTHNAQRSHKPARYNALSFRVDPRLGHVCSAA